MRPCFLYYLLPEIARWKCINFSSFDFTLKKERCYECPEYRNCCEFTGEPYKRTEKKNVVINNFRENMQEILIYDDPFDVIVDSLNLEAPKRNFVKVGDYLIPIDSECCLMRMQENSEDGASRSYDNIIAYALANNWTHFLTLTTDKKIVGNRYDDEGIKYCWKLFRQSCQRKDLAVKLLAIPELHKDGALHFHALMSSDVGFPIKPYYEKGILQYSGSGEMLWEFLDWKYGLATAVLFPPEELLLNNIRIGYYLTKYVTKQNMQGYDKKRYFRTHNLTFKTKECAYMSPEEIHKAVNDTGLKLVKELSGVRVYRNY